MRLLERISITWSMRRITHSLMRKLLSKFPVLVYDGLAILISWYAAFGLRYNLQPFPSALTSRHNFSAFIMLFMVQFSCDYYFRTYRGLWCFASLDDVVRIVKASLTSTLLIIPVFYLTSLLHDIPRSILPLYCIILTSIMCGGRLVTRLYWDNKTRPRHESSRKNVLIVGAGRAGESLVRDLKRHTDYHPVGFVDDNKGKLELEVHGVKVLGATSDLVNLVQTHSVELIFIAIPSANSAAMRRIVNYCESSQVPFRTLPSLLALAAGRVEVNALRAVHIDDLLGRDQVNLEWDKISAAILGRRVLVTGGGGSIGSELCRQISALKPSGLAIVDNSEFNLYKIEQELQNHFPLIPIEITLANVSDSLAINDIFSQFQPEIVFHAAAYKHVPMLENQIRIAVINNVLGTQNVAKASVAYGVDKFVLISTDKAVNPTNIMGTTKRIAEIYCQNLNKRVNTQFITVRFGNVIGSAGSVVPLFQKQLQEGGPLTVTHPDIERYFMTIPEACQLILQAMVNGSGGEIFVLDMGEPIKIKYLAEQMIRLAGKEPGKDIQIKYTGLRPGEKLYEELFHESEQLIPTEHEKLFKAKFRELAWNDLAQAMRMLTVACDEHQTDELFVLLKNLVPEFQINHLVV